jgi:hypothetical protein
MQSEQLTGTIPNLLLCFLPTFTLLPSSIYASRNAENNADVPLPQPQQCSSLAPTVFGFLKIASSPACLFPSCLACLLSACLLGLPLRLPAWNAKYPRKQLPPAALLTRYFSWARLSELLHPSFISHIYISYSISTRNNHTFSNLAPLY